MKRRALILGVAGQDGSYLAEHLLECGYEVEGIVRRNSTPEHQESRIEHLSKEVRTFYGDITDTSSITEILSKSRPDEIYNLAAQSHVRISFEIPTYTANANGLAVLNLLNVVRLICPESKIYQASSSEMFGSSVDPDGFQRETTMMTPVSPYGCSKLFAYSVVRNYRNAYGMFATNGILFNHESPRRGSNFVTSKIIKTAVAIKLGLDTRLYLGNLDSFRDWGHSKDYVVAMQKMLSLSEPGDFVVSTGQTYSVRDLCRIVFRKLEMDYEDYVIQDPKYYRPEELSYLRGDSSKFRNISGWEPKIPFDQMIEEMIQHWIKILDTK
jgi:GDPmannose 4,6-dehydratase